MSSNCFLLKYGTVLIHSETDEVIAKHADVLIRQNLIVNIADSIPPPDDVTEIIDCNEMIISPGFVDTHRHLWQTQLKGRHGDHLLADYIPTGNFGGAFFQPNDVQLGELSGALESIDAGTTTIVDHMHVVYSPAHITSALDGLIESGVRGIFCPCPSMRVKKFAPELLLEEEAIPSWFMPTLKEIANQRPLGDGRISLGLGFDSYGEPQEKIESIFSELRANDLQLITSHHVHGQMCKPLSTMFTNSADMSSSRCCRPFDKV